MSVIDDAKAIINGCRNELYGTAEDSSQRVADYWNAYLEHNGYKSIIKKLTSYDAMMMMVLFKIARLENNPNIYHQDNIVDIIGYAGLYDRIRGSDESK